jgi:hypothetical protein
MFEKVFGIGLNKTGTKTLGECLRRLGFDHMSCRRDLLAAYRNHELERVFAVTDQHSSFEDWPYPLMYRELLERYGRSAAFVLTVRNDAETWLESLKQHSLRTDPDIHCRLLAYGYNYPHGYEQQHLQFYRAHNAAVLNHFSVQGASAQLLEICWESGDGWAKLCNFLGIEAPDAEIPHVNKTGSTLDPERAAENLRRISQQQEVALQSA